MGGQTPICPAAVALPPPPSAPAFAAAPHACWLQGGCSTRAYGKMQQGECLILTGNCTLPADREAAAGVESGAGRRRAASVQAHTPLLHNFTPCACAKVPQQC